MPIYEFRCAECGSRFEAIRRMGDTGKDLECPSCGALGPEKLLSVFAAASSESRGLGSVSGSCGSGFS